MIPLCLIAAAESAAPVIGDTVVYEKWWVPVLGTILTLLAGVVTYALKKLADKLMEKIKATDAEKEAVQCLLEGMAIAQESIVRAAKIASEDGKLTTDEIAAAKKVAIEHALAVAKGPAKDVLLAMGQERMGSVIKQLLAKLTAKKEPA